MSAVLFSEILAYAIETETLCITLTGGEALLHDNFYEMYELAFDKGFLISVYSNGNCIPPHTLELFRDKPPFKIDISIYAMSDEIHNVITNTRLGIKPVIDNILALKVCNVPLTLKYVVLRQNISDLEHFIKFTENHNILNSITFANIPISIPAIKNKEFRISNCELKELLVRYPNRINIQSVDETMSCDIGNILHVTAGGLIKPCPVYSSPKILFNRKTIDEYVSKFRIPQGTVFCPAWEQLESRDSITMFLYGENNARK